MADMENTIVLEGGEVEYSATAAAVPIDTLIGALEAAKSEGATHVVQTSGNWRGPKWMHTTTEYQWMDEYDG